MKQLSKKQLELIGELKVASKEFEEGLIGTIRDNETLMYEGTVKLIRQKDDVYRGLKGGRGQKILEMHNKFMGEKEGGLLYKPPEKEKPPSLEKIRKEDDELIKKITTEFSILRGQLDIMEKSQGKIDEYISIDIAPPKDDVITTLGNLGNLVKELTKEDKGKK